MIVLTINDLASKLPRELLKAAQNFDRQPEDRDPLQAAIDDSLGEVRAFVNPDRLNDDTLRWAWLTIAVIRVRSRMQGGPSEREIKEYDRVMDTLRKIAEGKLPNLYSELQSASSIPNTSAVWGSNTKRDFSFRTPRGQS